MRHGGAAESEVHGVAIMAIICGALVIFAAQGAWLEFAASGTERTGMHLEGAFGAPKGVISVLGGLVMLLGGLALRLGWAKGYIHVGDAAISIVVGGGVSIGVALWAFFADVQESLPASVGFGLVVAFVAGTIGAVGAGVLLFKVESDS